MTSVSSEAKAVQTSDIKSWFAGRAPYRKAFLQQCGWGDAALGSVGEDCAYRRYFRLTLGAKTAILMEALPDHHTVATPGHSIHDFIRLGSWLHEQSINVPAIYEADKEKGYVLLEDFGDISFKTAMQEGVDPANLYELATDNLLKLGSLSDLPSLPSYWSSHVDYGRRRIVDWYMPVIRNQANREGLWQEFMAVWGEIEAALPPCPEGFLHIDYHAENLMWRPDRTGLARCGILDFQGAMKGPAVYDLANLLEDPRQDIATDLRTAIFARFISGKSAEEREIISAWYRVLATQFHCRVIGQFIKLALIANKNRYLEFVPRLESYLSEGLEDPLLAPLKKWFSENGLSFAGNKPDIQPEMANWISADAF